MSQHRDIDRKKTMSNQIAPLVSPLGSTSSLFPSRIQRATQIEVERTVGEALIARVREQARAALTNEALEATGALTALEGHLIQIAPLGEARYKVIVDSFTMSAASTIARLR